VTAAKVVVPYAEPAPWEPTFSAWRHGGWYVDNVQRVRSDGEFGGVCGPEDLTFSTRVCASLVADGLAEWENDDDPDDGHFTLTGAGVELAISVRAEEDAR
jgi:hypothetical protein